MRERDLYEASRATRFPAPKSIITPRNSTGRLLLLSIPRGVYLQDVGKHNVLYDASSRNATIINFEDYGQCSAEYTKFLGARERVGRLGPGDL